MNETKRLLILINGCRCANCNKDVPLSELQRHHIVPKYVFKHNHEEIDDSYDNSILLCRKCHVELHRYLWWDDEFQVMTSMFEDNKKPISD